MHKYYILIVMADLQKSLSCWRILVALVTLLHELKLQLNDCIINTPYDMLS